MVEYPSYPPTFVVFAAIGSMIFWSVKGRTKLKAYGLSEVFGHLPLSINQRYLLEFLVFVTLGCVVGVGITQPVNVRQALTAGIAWTSLFSTSRASTTKVPRANTRRT